VVETKYDDIRGGGVPMRLLGLQGKGVEKRWDGVGFFFFFFFILSIFLDMRWEMDVRLGFGMICGAGIIH
jgi:hypothetical protein